MVRGFILFRRYLAVCLRQRGGGKGRREGGRKRRGGRPHLGGFSVRIHEECVATLLVELMM